MYLYKYRNEFISFLKSENFYIKYCRCLKEESFWGKNSIVLAKFFDIVDARQYLDILNWRDPRGSITKRIELIKQLGYYKILWLLYLLNNNKFHHGFKNINDDVPYNVFEDIIHTLQSTELACDWRLIHELEKQLYRYYYNTNNDNNPIITSLKKTLQKHKERLIMYDEALN